jgi:hypothetical protein
LTNPLPSFIFRRPEPWPFIRAGPAPTEAVMVSSTQQFERIRKRKATQNGKWNKRARRRVGTPAFAVHPEGYDPKAADARPGETPAAAAPASKKA